MRVKYTSETGPSWAQGQGLKNSWWNWRKKRNRIRRILTRLLRFRQHLCWRVICLKNRMKAVWSGFGAQGKATWGLHVSFPPALPSPPTPGPLPSTSLPTRVPARPPTEQPQGWALSHRLWCLPGGEGGRWLYVGVSEEGRASGRGQ